MAIKTCHIWAFENYRYSWENFGQKVDWVIRKKPLERIIVYVKYEGSNLNATIVTLKKNHCVSWNILGLEENYQGS